MKIPSFLVFIPSFHGGFPSQRHVSLQECTKYDIAPENSNGWFRWISEIGKNANFPRAFWLVSGSVIGNLYIGLYKTPTELWVDEFIPYDVETMEVDRPSHTHKVHGTKGMFTLPLPQKSTIHVGKYIGLVPWIRHGIWMDIHGIWIHGGFFGCPPSLTQWLFLVPLKGGRWHSPSPNWLYIPLIYHL